MNPYLLILIVMLVSGCRLFGNSPECETCTTEDATTDATDATADVGRASCDDGLKNGDETDEDCGGTCAPCTADQACFTGADCDSDLCINNVCSDHCDDGMVNADESAQDCGGARCPRCDVGESCNGDEDCTTGFCADVCTVPDTCQNETLDGDESDIDCGGSCTPCQDGEMCSDPDDCQSGECSDGMCGASEWLHPISARRRKVIITNETSEMLTGFPVPVDIRGLGVSSAAQLKVFDSSGNVVPFDTDDTGTPETARAWIRIPFLPPGGETITLYYDNDGSDNSGNQAAVWAGEFVAVWHGGPQAQDSGPGNHDGVPSGLGIANGIVSGAFSFAGVPTSRVVIPVSGAFSIPGDKTISAWVNRNALQTSYRAFVAKASSVQLSNNETNFGTFNNLFSNEVYFAGVGGDRVDGQLFPIGTWHHVAVVYENTTVTLFLDGVRVASESFANAPSFDSLTNVTIGVDSNDGGTSFTDAFDGMIDEVRIESVARTAAWFQRMTAIADPDSVQALPEEMRPQ